MVCVSVEIRHAVSARVDALLGIARSEFNIELPAPKIKYALRNTTAGTADFNKWAVDFNPIFLNDNREEYIESTVGHEVAHLVAMKQYGLKMYPHGREWQRVMSVFGLKPQINHMYDCSKILVTNKWKCSCGVHDVTARQHKNLLNGAGLYHCQACRAAIQAVEDMPCIVHG